MNVNKRIDHTLLKADAKKENIVQLCEEAKKYGFASVCVNSGWVKQCVESLKDSDISVCTVVGFPLGAMRSKAKAFEAKDAVENGADEIDMVINIGALKDGNLDLVKQDIDMVVQAVEGRIVKVILETCLLSKDEIVSGCEICMSAHVDYVKTSTGFSHGGASVEDVKLMKETVGDRCKIKASGGIKTYQEMMEMIEAGADRIGTSKGVQIVCEKSMHRD